jgi:hypothetical protein
MRRLVAKILRYANDPLHADHTFAQPSERGCHKTAILYRALSGLERAIQRLAGFPGGPSADPNAAWEDALNFDQLPFKNCGEMNLEELERERGAVESVLETYYVTFVVLNDKAGEERLKSALETVRRIFARHGVAPVIVSVPVFEFMLRFYDPYAYTGLRRYRVSRYGKDILPSIHAPSKLSFIEAILAQTQNVLAASCSRPLFVPNGGVVWLKMWSSLLDRSLRIKLYRDSGSVIPLYERLLGEYDKHYPEYSRAIRDAQTSGAEASKITPQHFELLRSAANEINGRAENRS